MTARYTLLQVCATACSFSWLPHLAACLPNTLVLTTVKSPRIILQIPQYITKAVFSSYEKPQRPRLVKLNVDMATIVRGRYNGQEGQKSRNKNIQRRHSVSIQPHDLHARSQKPFMLCLHSVC